MKKNQYATALTLICLLLGIMIGVQYNTVKSQKALMENQRLTELTATLKQLQEENVAMENQLKEQKKLLLEFENESVHTVTLDKLQNEADQLRQFSGLTERTGSGVVVTMTDSSTKKGGDSNAYLVHAEDLLAIINELNVAGAGAISLNGQRIVAQSGVSCAGSIVMVNGVRVAAPFVISAIGDGEVLQSALKFPGGVVDNLVPWGIEITIRKEGAVSVPAYTQTALWKESAVKKEGAEE